MTEVDAVIDTVGGDTLENSYALVKKGGTLVTIAGMVSEDKAKARGIKALGSGRGPAELLRQISDLMGKGSIRSEIGRVFPVGPKRRPPMISVKADMDEDGFCSKCKIRLSEAILSGKRLPGDKDLNDGWIGRSLSMKNLTHSCIQNTVSNDDNP